MSDSMSRLIGATTRAIKAKWYDVEESWPDKPKTAYEASRAAYESASRFTQNAVVLAVRDFPDQAQNTYATLVHRNDPKSPAGENSAEDAQLGIPERVQIIEECSPNCSLAGTDKITQPEKLSPEHSLKARTIARVPVPAKPHAALYAPLREWQTRILTLRPGQFGESLSADLRFCDILYGHGVALEHHSQRVDFEALSYCWGSKRSSQTLICNGTPVIITQNLYDALQRLRKADEPRHLWVDAICIDQQNAQERASQVRNMLNIYKKAIAVIAWLGEQEPQSLGLELFSSIRRLRQSPEVALQAGLPLCLHHAEYAANGMSEVFNRSYFRRVWVRQETWAAGPRLSFMCGSTILTRSQLRIAARTTDLIVRELNRPKFSGSVTSFSSNMSQGSCHQAYLSILNAEQEEQLYIETRQAGHTDEPTELSQSGGVFRVGDILEVLRLTEGSECTDSRDHIYGLLGMTTTVLQSNPGNEVPENILPVDYTISATRAFVNLAWYIIRRDGWLSIFYLKSAAGEDVTIGGVSLPSWCPDWRCLEAHKCFADRQYFEALREFTAFHKHRRQYIADRFCKLQHTTGKEPWRFLCLRGVHVAFEVTKSLRVKVDLPRQVTSELPWGLTSTKLQIDLTAPPNTQPGQDVFVLFQDEPLPVALRRSTTPGDNTYQFVGTCDSNSLRGSVKRSLWHAVTEICEKNGIFETFVLR